jgi:legumain
MFENLPNNIEIVASTAANAEESSWGTYCPPDDMIDGVAINSCLGDLYSINWMEDSDKADTCVESLITQF